MYGIAALPLEFPEDSLNSLGEAAASATIARVRARQFNKGGFPMAMDCGWGWGVMWLVTLAVSGVDDWRQFRGANSAGHAPVPVRLDWKLPDDLVWELELPGPGSSSPIVVDEQIFVTCYSGYGLDPKQPGDPQQLTRHLLCLDRRSGALRWKKDLPSLVEEDPYRGMVPEHGYASSTPVSDGSRVVAFFGKSGVYCFDREGQQLWHRQVGQASDPLKFGDGSSPIIYRDLVLVNAGNAGRSVLALKLATGEVAWEVKDERYKNSWATPMLVSINGHDELVLPFPGMIEAFDPMTGKKRWHADSPMVDSIYGTLVERNGVVMAMGGRNQAAIAVRCGGQGDVTPSHVVWQTRLQSSIGTPLVVGPNLFWASQGKAFCADCSTGELVYQEPLAGGVSGHAFDYPSPVEAGEEILFLYKSGQASVTRAAPPFQLVRELKLGADGERFNATPAIADDLLVIRSDRKVYGLRLKK